MIFWALVKAEWTKTMRMRMTYIAFLAVAMLVALIQVALYFKLDNFPLARAFKAFDLKLSWFINGYVTTQIAMLVGFFMLMIPLTIMTFSRQVAGETLNGTLRLMLSRPISRFALINAKFVVCMFYSLLLMGFFFAFSYGLGTLLFGWTPSVTASDRHDLQFSRISEQYRDMNRAAEKDRGRRNRWGVPSFDYRKTIAGLQIRNEIEQELKKRLLSPAECMKRLALAWLLTSWALLTLGAIAFFYSTLNRHPIAAMGITLATFFLVAILEQLASPDHQLIPLFTSIEPYLFTKAMGYWRACFKPEIDWQEIRHGARLLGAYTAGFYALAQLIFWRRDVTS